MERGLSIPGISIPVGIETETGEDVARVFIGVVSMIQAYLHGCAHRLGFFG
jgi:hypothetical protein